MKEVKSPKKPLIYYYGIVLLIIFLFNILVRPMLLQGQVVEVDYGAFMDKISEKKIDVVQVEDTQILFTDKDDSVVYKTGIMEDPTLTQRLYDAGAQFGKVIEEPMSPLVSIFLTVILPILIFVGLGQYMSKKLMNQLGGKNSMRSEWGKAMPRFMSSPQKGSISAMWLGRMRQRRA